MTPPSSGDGRSPISRGSSPVLPISDDAPVSGPSPVPRSERISDGPILLPARHADLDRLQNILDGQITHPYEHLRASLEHIANPLPNGGYDFTLPGRNFTFRLRQTAPDQPILLTAIRNGSSADAAKPETHLELTYLPNGQVFSDLHPEAHTKPLGLEDFHHKTLDTLLRERVTRIKNGRELYVLLRDSLQGLRGRPELEGGSVWYDNFMVRGDSAYTFRRSMEEFPNPQLNRIEIYAERLVGGVAEKRLLFSVSPTGEINVEAGASVRSAPTQQQLDLVETSVRALETARRNPDSYYRSLVTATERIVGPGKIGIPTIARSVEMSATRELAEGPLGEPIVTLRKGQEVFSETLPWNSHEWVNPANGETIRLTPRGRHRYWMSSELFRWSKSWLGNMVFGGEPGTENARSRQDWMRMHLFPDGGGRLDIYRDGQLHDIIIGGNSGPMWRARREIKRTLGRDVTPTPIEDIQTVLANRASGVETVLPFQMQPAPDIDLSQLHFSSLREATADAYRPLAGEAIPIRDAESAWRRIQLQIPEGLDVRVRSSTHEKWYAAVPVLPTPPGETNRINVDFINASPALHLEIRHYDKPEGEGPPVRGVEIVKRLGPNHEAVVYENGLVRPDLAVAVSRRLEAQARAALGTSRWVTAARTLPRVYYYYKTSGATYGLSYFATLPAIIGLEHAIMTPGERALVGTPVPRLSLSYFYHDFSVPFMTISTASGAAGVVLDGLYNMAPGLARTWNIWTRTPNTLAQAYRLARPSFFNPSSTVRPVADNLFVRGFLQRAIPLFAGMSALEYSQTGHFTSPQFWRNFRDTAVVSFGSAAMLRGLTASTGASEWLVARGLFQATSVGSVGSRYSLTFRGGVVLAGLELLVLGAISAAERTHQLTAMEDGMREDLGAAVDRRNELITRLEHGEAVPPRELVAADHEFNLALNTYRQMLVIRERRDGSGNFSALTSSNDFEDAYLAGGDPAHYDSNHAMRISELYSRRASLDRDLGRLYADHGLTPPEVEGGEDMSLREFLERTSTMAASEEPEVAPPATLESIEGRAIIEQFQWEVRHNPSFLRMGNGQRADYILENFTGFEVASSEGGSRPWNRAEAMAFLHQLDAAEEERATHLQPSLLQPSHPDAAPNRRMMEMASEEREIRNRERRSHTYITRLTGDLARNTEDLDEQIQSYINRTNARMATALDRYMAPEAAVASL